MNHIEFFSSFSETGKEMFWMNHLEIDRFANDAISIRLN